MKALPNASLRRTASRLLTLLRRPCRRAEASHFWPRLCHGSDGRSRQPSHVGLAEADVTSARPRPCVSLHCLHCRVRSDAHDSKGSAKGWDAAFSNLVNSCCEPKSVGHHRRYPFFIPFLFVRKANKHSKYPIQPPGPLPLGPLKPQNKRSVAVTRPPCLCLSDCDQILPATSPRDLDCSRDMTWEEPRNHALAKTEEALQAAQYTIYTLLSPCSKACLLRPCPSRCLCNQNQHRSSKP